MYIVTTPQVERGVKYEDWCTQYQFHNCIGFVSHNETTWEGIYMSVAMGTNNIPGL